MAEQNLSFVSMKVNTTLDVVTDVLSKSSEFDRDSRAYGYKRVQEIDLFQP